MLPTRIPPPRLALCALAALVALGAGRAAAEAPCLDDAARLCPGLPAGDGRLWTCLVQNQLQLSSACVRTIQEVRRRANEFNADCAGDIWRFCPSTSRGGLRILDCLRYHVGRRELSTTCEDAVTTALERLQEYSDACTGDAARLCPGVQAGSGQVIACLRSQSERLSSRCRKVVSP